MWFEDYLQDAQADYDDLVVRVEAVPLPASEAGAGFGELPVALSPKAGNRGPILARRRRTDRAAHRLASGYQDDPVHTCKAHHHRAKRCRRCGVRRFMR